MSSVLLFNLFIENIIFAKSDIFLVILVVYCSAKGRYHTMKLLKGHLKKESVIEKAASHFGKTPKKVQKEIKEIIDIAWASDDPQVKAFQQQHFPNGKPTPEEFITVVAKTIK